MNWIKSKKIVITHSGHFHADDAFSVASIRLLSNFKNAKLIRTRDVSVFSKGDIVVDVGGVYDPSTNRFDHHQTGGAGTNPNGIPYSGFGLFWKKFGKEICGSDEAAEIVRNRVVQSIDAVDNGFLFVTSNVPDAQEYNLDDMIKSFNLSWKDEGNIKEENKRFNQAVEVASLILDREIKNAQDKVIARAKTKEIYKNSTDKKIVIFPEYMPFMDTLIKYPEPLFAILPHSVPGLWAGRAIQVDKTAFVYRKTFPKAWAGKRDSEMAKVSGVSDAVFCHNSCHLVSARSKEGVIKLVRLALAYQD